MADASWYEQDRQRWQVIDVVMKKALAVLMGASVVQFVEEFKPAYMSNLRWTGIQVVGALSICPTIGLFLFNFGQKGLTDVRSSQRALLSMTAAQVLGWANKFFVAEWLTVIPGGGTVATIAVAFIVWASFVLLSFLQHYLGLQRWDTYSSHPFTRLREKKQLASQYYDFILRSLPLSVGFTVNNVCVLGRDYVLYALDRAVGHFQRQDEQREYRSLHMFVYASYFVLISALSVLVAIHNVSDIFELLRPRAPERERSREAVAIVDDEETWTDIKYDVDDDGAATNVERLERRVAIIESTLGVEEEDLSQELAHGGAKTPMEEPKLERTKTHMEEVQDVAMVARGITIKFVFAWSVTGFIETFFFEFLMRCYDPIPKCGPGQAFLLAIVISFMVFKYVWTIATVDDENNKYVDKLFQLQKGAAPLNVGFAWNRFMGAWSAQISRELPEFTRTATFMVVVIFYIFLSIGYHVYRVMGADLKVKPLPRVA